MSSGNSKKNIFQIAFLGAFFLLAIKLFHLQIWEGREYAQHSERNRIRHIVLQATRGIIYDRNGDLLVENRPSYSISAIPYETLKNSELINRLSQLLGLTPEQIKRRLREGEGPFMPVKLLSDVELSVLIELEENKLDFPGVLYDVEPKRDYSAGINAAHLFGYLGEVSKAEMQLRKDEEFRLGDIVGKKGVEKIYDRELRGKAGVDFVQVNALGREVADITEEGESVPIPGSDLYLTIDLGCQKIAEDAFVNLQGGVVMLDCRDGGVLVLCSKPDYDPSLFSGKMSAETWRDLVNDPRRPLYDRMIQSEFPPGSTYKPILAIAGLETDKVTPQTTNTCVGFVSMGVRIFKCWNVKGHGTVDLVDAIKVSCNSYFYRLSLKVGLDPWAEYSKRFGFGTPTGIDLANESPGNVPDRAYLDKVYGKNGWTRGSLLNLGIGQGDLLVTPIQMAQFAMMLANKGLYYRPHVVHKTFDYASGQMTPYRVPPPKRVPDVSEETFDIVREGMRRVVNEIGGTGRASYVPNVVAAGKTGTAQNPHGEPHAWFIGFAPIDNPQVAICVLVENGGGGGAQAAPIAGAVLKQYFAPKDAEFQIALSQDRIQISNP